MFSRVHFPENVSGRDEKGEKMTDEFYMRRAIELAKKGRGWTNPNPMVGAVIVKNGTIIGEGYHEKCGELHAERNAIASLTECAEGGTLYVTLEPCCHYGKTPPCTEAILEQKTARVVDRIERSESESVRQRQQRFCARQASRWKRISFAKNVMR